MNIFSKWFLKPKAATLPPLPAPKVPSSKGVTYPYLGKTKGSKLPNSATNTTNLSLNDYVRNEATINQVIKKLVLTSPDLSNTIETKLRTAVSSSCTVIAYDEDGIVSEEGTRAANAFIMRLNYSSPDYTHYTSTTDIRSLATSCLFDILVYGAGSLELVLGSTRFPAFFRSLPTRLITWGDATPRTFPIYKDPVKGDISLDYPTIFYIASQDNNESPYADSPLTAAIQACLFDAAFLDDLRRAATRSIFQRLLVTINSDKYMTTLPLEVQTNKDLLKSHMDATIAALESQMANLDPGDSIVVFDTLTPSTIQDANRSEDRSIQVLNDLIAGKIASGAKILPAIIGRGESSNSASTESMLFLKAISSVQQEWNMLFSRALTLAVRLMGHDVNVSYQMEEVNLRPSLELESFRSQKQARLLELLSHGLNDDISTCIQLTGSLPPKGYVPLSGTGFYKKAADTSTGNDYSNTSVDTTSGKTDSTQSQKDQKK